MILRVLTHASVFLLVFGLVELGFLLHFGLIWNIIVTGVALWVLAIGTSWVIYTWFRAVVSIYMIRAGDVHGELISLVTRIYVVFVTSTGVVLFIIWGLALICYSVLGNTVNFNFLVSRLFVCLFVCCVLLTRFRLSSFLKIGAGFGWLGFCFSAISGFHLFVGRKVLQIFDTQLAKNPDQLVYRPEVIRFRVSVYTSVQFVLFVCSGILFFALTIWSFVVTATDTGSLHHYFYIHHFVLNILCLLQLTATTIVITKQERHANFTTASKSGSISKDTSLSRQSPDTSSSHTTRRESIEDALIPGLGRPLAPLPPKLSLPAIAEQDTAEKMETFLSLMSTPQTPDSARRPSLFQLWTLGDEEAPPMDRRPSREEIAAKQ